MKYSKTFNSFLLVFGILCWLYYLGMGFAVRFGQSFLWVWPLLGTSCIARYFIVKKSIASGKAPANRKLIIAFRVTVVICLAVFLFAECFIVSGAFEKAPDGLDAIIVLGARVNGLVPSGALVQRTERAAVYLSENPETVCIASGGQGSGEEISEALCIKQQLLSLGISEDRIILEDSSTNTSENLDYSTDLLPDNTETVGIVTNDFHVYRALLIAGNYPGYEFYGIPAKSTPYGFIHYAMREFFGLGKGILNHELVFAG